MKLGSGDVPSSRDPDRSSRVLRNNGTGEFTLLDMSRPASRYAPGHETFHIKTADVNADGNVDLQVRTGNGRGQGRDIQLLIGNGDATFGDETDARHEQDHSNPVLPVMAFIDMNHDGAPDIAGQAGRAGYPNLYQFNDGTDYFVQWSFPGTLGYTAFLNINHDGKLDILSVRPGWEGQPEHFGYQRYTSCREPTRSAATPSHTHV